MPQCDFQILFQNDDILAVNKPEGISTHATHPDDNGLVEKLRDALNLPTLGVHQRLDKETSGLILFSTSKAGSKFLSEAFESRKMRKIYLAVVAGKPHQQSGSLIHKLIHQDHKTYENSKGKTAKSSFCIKKVISPFSLLELELHTGITHQLRVQCALEGFPILGDNVYGGGTLADRLFLHAHQLYFENPIPGTNIHRLTAPLPESFENLTLERILSGILRHAEHPAPDEAFRLFTPQSSGIPEIVLEKLGSHLLIRHLEPLNESLWTRESLSSACSLFKSSYQAEDVICKIHKSHQKTSASPSSFEDLTPDVPETPFIATENGLRFTFDLSQGIATGLYLDQRNNRAWVRRHAFGNVLNLFAYTCAFSVAAAAASHKVCTTSVDISQKSLNQGKTNFEINGLDPNQHRFFADDVFKFIKRTINNGKKFNMVICDPPTFGRANGSAFQIEQDLETLVSACMQMTAPGGYILFCVNNRNIRLNTLSGLFQKAARHLNMPFRKGEAIVTENALGPLGVGTDLKTCRIQLNK